MVSEKKRETLQEIFNEPQFIDTLKNELMKTIKKSFIEYAQKHGCKPENEVIEWNRFLRILKKYL